MPHIDDVRLVLRHRLLTGMTFHTRLHVGRLRGIFHHVLQLLTLECLGKRLREHHFAGLIRSVYDVCM